MHDILVHPDPSDPSGPVAGYAIALAGLLNAHLTVTGVAFDKLPASYMLEAGRALVDQLAQRERDAMKQAIAAFEANARAQGAMVESVPLEGLAVGVEHALAGLARHFDLTIVAQPQHNDAQMSFVEALLFESGRPILMVPHSIGSTPKFDVAIVAWNGSKEAARSIAGAMPLLRRAKIAQVVSIVEPKKRDAVDLPGFNITRHLARHGVAAELKRITTNLDPGEALLSHAADEGADFIVMGAYGQSRLREMLLGGATRTMLKSMTLPAFMAH
jgi:nucleotide-binding universal stress UspA family protein